MPQALTLLSHFPSEDYLQMILVLSIIDRVLDTHLLYTLLDTLEKPVAVELGRRLGYLNLINPLRPERYYDLDLRIRDEREMVRLLAQLAHSEVTTDTFIEHHTHATPPHT